jgi:glycosyltransferase involved in cell wall biosynthesis
MIDGLVLAQFRPIILTVMGGDILPEQRFRGARTWLIKKMLDAADVITSKSSFIDEGLNLIGDYAHKIRRVTWGVDTQKFRPGLDVTFLRKRLNIQPDDLVVFCPRICQPFYNQHLIIQAFASFVRQSEPRIKAKLIISELFADEAYGQYLRTLVAQCGLTEQVRFGGSIPHEEMPAYFNLADIMVAIPPSDGMPQSLYEAMACGSYPILGDLRQYKELVQDRVNGRLVPIGNVRTLAEVIIHSALDPQQREGAAVINRQRIMEIADKGVQERLVNTIYDEVWQKYAMVSARS